MIEPSKVLCQWKEPAFIARELIKVHGESGLIWLDGDGSNIGNNIVLGIDPVEEICCYGLPSDKESLNPFEALRNLSPGHWTGWLSYEASAWIEPSNPWKRDDVATLWLGRHDPILRFDVASHKLWVEGCDPIRLLQLKDWVNSIESTKESASIQLAKIQSISLEEWEWLTDIEQFKKNVQCIQEFIKGGDIFQANLSACCRTTLPQENSSLGLFERLRKSCPSPFGGIAIASGQATGEAVISASPERFIKILATGELETRPIKGTRPRHINPREDALLAAELVSSTKDRAENIMIVDLMRNDLGRICQPGSINVSQLLGLESYKNVHHLTSVIKGQLNQDKTWVDVLEACWPGGSISGAPKLRACQRLHELEPIARGPFCGSFLHIDWDGSFDSNILIRSIIKKDSTLRAYAGCGIVADSDPGNESAELNWKLIPILQALE